MVGSVAGHKMTQHGRAAEEQQIWKTLTTVEELRIYCMDFLSKEGPQSCPVEVCPGRAATRTDMRFHFLHGHFLDTVVIMEEVNLPHPRCSRCVMIVPRQVLKGRHPATAQYARGSEQKRRQLAEAELRESLERASKAYREPLQNVTAFKYLGRVLTAGGDNCILMVCNLGESRNIWGRLLRILSLERADLKVSGYFYKAVSQAVLLFGAETWVITSRMERALYTFHIRVARRITGRQSRRQGGGNWAYSPLEEEMGKQALRGLVNPSLGFRTRSHSIL